MFLQTKKGTSLVSMVWLGSFASQVTFKFQTPSRTFICCLLTMLFPEVCSKGTPIEASMDNSEMVAAAPSSAHLLLHGPQECQTMWFHMSLVRLQFHQGKVIQNKEAERNLHGINLWSTEKARWKTGCCHGPYPVLGTFECLSQVEPPLHNNRRPDCDEKGQHV